MHRRMILQDVHSNDGYELLFITMLDVSNSTPCIPCIKNMWMIHLHRAYVFLEWFLIMHEDSFDTL